MSTTKRAVAVLFATLGFFIVSTGVAQAVSPVTPEIRLTTELPQALPACQANFDIDGIAVERWNNGAFKIVLTPSWQGRSSLFLATNDVWHLVQACVPGLYGALADTIYAQLDCHVWGRFLSDGSGYNKANVASGGDGFATGSTWDFESWHTLRAGDLGAYKAQTCNGSGTFDETSTSPSWSVYFGGDPLTKLDQDLEAAKAAAAARPKVSVRWTQGTGLWARSGPGGTSARLFLIPEGTTLTLKCQMIGQTISDWTTSNIWDQVLTPSGQWVFVSDVFVDTGSDGQVAPSC